MMTSPLVSAFNRIQFSCTDLDQAIADYQVLFNVPPSWQGKVTFADTNQASRCCWFCLQNTVLELVETPEAAQAIAGLVLRSNGLETTPTTAAIRYSDDRGEALEYPALRLPKDRARQLNVTLESGLATADLSPAETVLRQRWQQPSAIGRVDHLVLYTSDADDCVRCFGDMGMRLALDQTVPEWGGRMLFFRCGKLTLEIIQPNKPLKGEDTFWGIAYQVDDLHQVHRRLMGEAVEISDPRDGRKPGTRVATLKSHNLGIPTLLVQQ